ncbi:MAG: hypothetical protein K5906_02425 [Bacilli bacterium]|nr:hypothetical protein [Bacilli bacterium]
MTFSRTRLLIKISIIGSQLGFILSLVLSAISLVLGIILAAVIQDFSLLIVFVGTIFLAAYDLVYVLFMHWICKDFVELDNDVKSLENRCYGLERRIDELTKRDITAVITEIDPPKEEAAPVVESPVKEDNKQPIENKVEEQQPKDPVTPKAPKVSKVVHIEQVEVLKPGDPIILNRDFSDYGFEFKKGMKGIFQTEIESTGMASVRMTSGVKGFFRFPKEYLAKDPKPKKK